MAIGAWAFFGNKNGIQASSRTVYDIYLYYFLFLHLEIPFEVRVDLLFAVLLAIYIAAFGGSFLIGKRFDRAVRESFKRPLAETFRNWLFAMPTVTSMLLFSIIGLALFQESQGIQTGSLNYSNPYLFFVDLSYASVVEEIGSRIIPLGTFLVIHALIFNRNRFAGMTRGQMARTVLFGFLLPDHFRRNLGLNTVNKVGFRRSIGRGDWFIVLLTALSFGLAHYFGGAGWGVGKISLEFLTGMVMGPIFLLYGAPATILIHWMFNSYTSSYYLLGAPEMLIVLPVLAILITGVTGWIGLFGKGILGLWLRIRPTRVTTMLRNVPAAYCGQCGQQFVDNALYCRQCGAARVVVQVGSASNM